MTTSILQPTSYLWQVISVPLQHDEYTPKVHTQIDDFERIVGALKTANHGFVILLG